MHFKFLDGPKGDLDSGVSVYLDGALKTYLPSLLLISLGPNNLTIDSGLLSAGRRVRLCRLENSSK